MFDGSDFPKHRKPGSSRSTAALGKLHRPTATDLPGEVSPWYGRSVTATCGCISPPVGPRTAWTGCSGCRRTAGTTGQRRSSLLEIWCGSWSGLPQGPSGLPPATWMSRPRDWRPGCALCLGRSAQRSGPWTSMDQPEYPGFGRSLGNTQLGFFCGGMEHVLMNCLRRPRGRWVAPGPQLAPPVCPASRRVQVAQGRRGWAVLGALTPRSQGRMSWPRGPRPAFNPPSRYCRLVRLDEPRPADCPAPPRGITT